MEFAHFLLLFLAADQFTVHVLPPVPTFSVVVLEPAVVVPVQPIQPPVQSTVDPDYYIVFFTSSSCPPCLAFKSSPEFTRLKHKFLVRECNVDDEPTWTLKVARTPTFWLVSRATRTRVAGPWEGVQSLAIFEQAASDQRKPRSAPKPQVTLRASVNRLQEHTWPKPQVRQSMSHSDMVDLHNRLHGGGQWSWPGDIRTHLRTVHGQNL